MSNKIVPNIYRAVIDDVISAIKPEFEDYGVSEDVLASLQTKWQEKVIASNCAEFDPPPAPVPAQVQPAVQAAAPQWPHMMPGHPHYATPSHMYPSVKAEPQDPRYLLSTPAASYLKGPSAPSYALPGPIRPMPFNSPVTPYTQAAPSTAAAGSAAAARPGIPQTDGPSEDSDDSDSSPAYVPRSSHPSLPQPRAPQPTVSPDEEAINSDLDDSDEEEDVEATEHSAGPDGDIVFCTYDKVARVKNKWKCVLKDGMIHINGKDYLFQKCTGEFEW